MGLFKVLSSVWPVARQALHGDLTALGPSAWTERSAGLRPRIDGAEVHKSVCPYCAVGCGQNVYVKDGRILDIEGDEDSPVSRGRLCPKGAATFQLVTGSHRIDRVLHRRPFGTHWEGIPLAQAMEMVAQRVKSERDQTWEDKDPKGNGVQRTLGIAHLGGATLDNEENYLLKKLYTALGVIQVENQARIWHSSTVPGLGISFGRGGATTFQQDLQHSDCIVIEGSNMAECHPVGFQWVMEAKRRGATIIHVDPRFTRTSAMADIHVPIRAGTDIAFLGGIVNHIIQNERYFRDYVVNYTNAPVIVEDDFRDTEDLDGLFSGWDPEKGEYRIASWQYEGAPISASAGDIEMNVEQGQAQASEGGSGAMSAVEKRDDTLQDPRCVFQIVRRHFSRYTPEVVEDICGIPQDTFLKVAQALCDNSGPERTAAFCYAVGWTQHSVGVQYIRTAAIVQLLLGNIGRPGGGILALRGHASIQGSTDIPTLYDLLPGYIPMPKASFDVKLEDWLNNNGAHSGWWVEYPKYAVSLLKAYFGDNATKDNNYCYDLLPRLTGDHSHMTTVADMADGAVRGYFLMGENPTVGSMHGALHRKAMRELDWLVVRDFAPTESAEFWRDGPEIARGEVRPEDIKTEVFFFPAATHTEKDGTFTNTQRLLQWHHQAVDPPGDARSDLHFMFHLGRRLKELYASSTEAKDKAIQHLAWDFPTKGEHEEPEAEAVLKEINGYTVADRAPVESYTSLRDDGSTACGCWIYSGVYKDGVNQAARKKSWKDQGSWVAPEWAWAWPSNRRIMYNRASGDPDRNPWSERKKYVWWDAEKGEWTGFDEVDFIKDRPPDYRPKKRATGLDTISGTDPFVRQADGKGWILAPSGLLDGPLPTHYEPQESVQENLLYGQQCNPARWSKTGR